MRHLDIRPRFIRELRRFKRLHGWTIENDEVLDLAVDCLMAGKPLPAIMRDHALQADYAGFRDFHVDGDVVVIYRLTPVAVILHRIGNHADIFVAQPGRTAGP